MRSIIFVLSLNLSGVLCLDFCDNNVFTHHDEIGISTDYVYQASVNTSWEGGDSCAVEIVGYQKEVMLELLYVVYDGDNQRSDSCGHVPPYVLLDGENKTMEYHGAISCPVIDGIIYSRWSAFLTIGTIKLQLLKSDWDPFQVNITLVPRRDILTIGELYPSSNKTHGYLMSHKNFTFQSIPNGYYGTNIDGTFGVNGIPLNRASWLALDWIFLDIGNKDHCSSYETNDKFSIYYDSTNTTNAPFYKCNAAKMSTNLTQVRIPLRNKPGFYFQFKSNTGGTHRGSLLRYTVVSCDTISNASYSSIQDNRFSISCDDGYNLTTTNSSYLCDVNGGWLPMKPNCVADSSTTSGYLFSSSMAAENSAAPPVKAPTLTEKIIQFFKKTDNITAVASGAGGLLLLIIVIVLAVKVAKSAKRSPKANGQIEQDLQRVEDTEDTIGKQKAAEDDYIGRAVEDVELVPGDIVNGGDSAVAIEDLYAPIIKAKKSDTNVDMVDNDLYGS